MLRDDVSMSQDNSAISVRHSPRPRAAGVTVADFTLLVRIPGKPATFRAFTDFERGEAAALAAEVGGTVIPLPLDQPESAAAPDHD